ncbi:mannose-1-phosphate guanylyltransferase [Paenibacillus cellulosilyticus]|uniref:Mannose-1-phosphate guanylyltransferase n=1 Tax=Paenibacillus cellulosilyticus TaxID=375489 RepID=A0A2V2YZ34_9BACL|nr:sugar phosphate nucleotidyltransferase [Paenibacillus cellulosilyticus]PWW07518.1 mannose-1-phosphate guanylyltransferase [Paenibacillus cellulosilyticus]QKS44329.1 mannose-1-phosphate guanylyltransferase [Paenibacillus cellulosilyticus]
MMNIMIMAGGKGTRFWPRSVKTIPKQFLSFGSGPTLIQQTVDRFRRLVPDERLFIAAPSAHIPLVTSQLPSLATEQIFIEPEQKGTAACIAYAAYSMLAKGDDRPIVFVPADQYVADDDVYLAAIERAAQAASAANSIVTLGIRPDRPDTGFGYMEIEPDEGEIETDAGDLLHKVKRFIEKPDAATAEVLIQQHNVYWNSGIVAWRPSSIMHHITQKEPELWRPFKDHQGDAALAYAAIPELSIDYAILEKTDEIRCIPIDCGWDDIGSWAAFRRHHVPDADGNVAKGAIRLYESEGNTVYSETETLLIGVSDLIVVSTPHGLLVCHRSEEPRLKHWLNESSR